MEAMESIESKWIGKAVSIECEHRLGIFQGIIREISPDEITIIRAFRNGLPLRKQDAEVTLKSSDILKIDLIPSYNGQTTLTATSLINKPTPVKLPNFYANIVNDSALNSPSTSSSSNEMLQSQEQQQQYEPPNQPHPNWPIKDNAMSMAKKLANIKIHSPNGITSPSSCASQQKVPCTTHMPKPNDLNNMIGKTSTSPSLASYSNSVSQFFGNMIPAKVEVRMGSAFSACSSMGATLNISSQQNRVDNIDNYDASNGNNCMRATNDRSPCNGRQPQQQITANNGQSNRNSSGSGNGNGNGNGNNSNNSRSRNSSTNGQQSILNGFINGNANGNGNGNGNGSNSNNNINAFNSNNINNNGNGNGNGRINRHQRKQLRRENSMRQQNRGAFATSIDDPLLNEDFDFEGNLALFDKQAIWNVIEAGVQKPPPEQTLPTTEKKYRHDENILVNEPPQLRGIEAIFDGSTDFVTDTGLIIPTIPHFVRSKIEITADRNGLTLQRQFDILSRGATDLAILMLGGARRLTPNNCHQWPKIIIICEKSQNYRSANVGASTGRHLASHGIEVLLYLEENESIEQRNSEISLFKATGNSVVYSVNDLPNPDLVILSTNTMNLSAEVKKWLKENRASIYAIDPPANGIRDITIKCAILPILPLNGISTNNCGKLYLCNIGIPEKFYRDAGVKYKSPFGHKFVIPIHPKH